MHMRRREFVLRGCEVAGSVAASLFCGRGIRAAFPGKPLLVIGVEAGVIAGYHVTIFNRGMTYPELFPYVEHLHGFRGIDEKDQGFSVLSGRTWDAAVDVWPSDPTMVETLAKALQDRVGHYLYVSSCAVYKSFEKPGLTEDAPVRERPSFFSIQASRSPVARSSRTSANFAPKKPFPEFTLAGGFPDRLAL